jgi:protein-S-isoprenylcysteine O-methyltransferase Ste14
MGRLLAFVYGVISYLVFFGAFLYAIGFVGNIVVPKSIDSGTAGPFVPSLIIDAINLLVLSFILVRSFLSVEWVARKAANESYSGVAITVTACG